MAEIVRLTTQYGLYGYRRITSLPRHDGRLIKALIPVGKMG
jgi:hypothetical protein